MASLTTTRLVLVTGAAGNIGRYFAEHSNKDKYKLRLMVSSLSLSRSQWALIGVCLVHLIQVHSLREPEKTNRIKDFGELVESELDDMKQLEKVCQGVHTIIHLAGDPNASATWESLKKANIDGYTHTNSSAFSWQIVMNLL